MCLTGIYASLIVPYKVLSFPLPILIGTVSAAWEKFPGFSRLEGVSTTGAKRAIDR
jgi:hypothetical protein